MRANVDTTGFGADQTFRTSHAVLAERELHGQRQVWRMQHMMHMQQESCKISDLMRSRGIRRVFDHNEINEVKS